MKWGIVILLLLGIVAAACAALLVSAMVGSGSSATAARNPQGFEVVVARKSLPAMSVVTVDDFVKQMVSRNELPQGRISSPTRVIGRTLAVPVVEGQVLTESCFVPDGTGAILASQLPEGMRAFTVNLNSRAVPDQVLLYPSCVVDVLFSAKLSSRDARGEAVSATILQGIRVLAVQGESVVSNPQAEGNSKAEPRNRTGMVQVTLLVNQKQAEALQLAVDNGMISLAFRNPLDKKLGEMEGMVLNQGQLATLGSALTPENLAAAQKARQREEEKEWLESQIVASADPNATPQAAPSGMPGFAPSSQDYQAPKSPRWGVTVIRGTETKTEEFSVSTSEAGGK